MASRPTRIFLSYSHDSVEHRERVLDLADRLRGDGLDAHLDRYETAPEEGWPRWMIRQIEEADFVGFAGRPSVASDGDSFLVVWPDQGSIYARLIDGRGTPSGPAFEVDGFSNPKHFAPVVAGGPVGRYLIVWQGEDPGNPDGESEIFGRFYRVDEGGDLGRASLTVETLGGGSGVVKSFEPGIDCGLDCSESLAINDSLTVQATANPGSVFAGWDGACSSLGPREDARCTVNLTRDKSIEVHFEQGFRMSRMCEFPSSLLLRGSARFESPCELELTEVPAVLMTENAGETAAIWYSQEKYRLADGFETSLTFSLSEGTEGLAFVIQDAGPDALGEPGPGLGYAGLPGLAVEIDARSNPGDQSDPTHVFKNSGSFPVSLTVTGSDGGSSSLTQMVNVEAISLEADFTWTPTSPQVGERVVFADRSRGSISSWFWEFGFDLAHGALGVAQRSRIINPPS